MTKDDQDLSRFLTKGSSERRKLFTPSTYSDKSSQSELLGLTTKPSSDTGIALKPEAKETVSYLVPDWKRRRLLYSIKERTLLRIYLSKWFHQGLDYQERELLLLLCESQGLTTELLILKVQNERLRLPAVRELGETDLKDETVVKNSFVIKEESILAINLVGASVLARLREERETEVYTKGIVDWENEDLLKLVYSETDFRAVWKLRSFQSLRDKLFAKFDRAKQTGKLGIQKPRIRGYTDGRGSAGDTRRVKMAREADAWFWREQDQRTWDELFQELERYGLPRKVDKTQT
jgi:hypothetical protein